jgi:hypothetical protein
MGLADAVVLSYSRHTEKGSGRSMSTTLTLPFSFDWPLPIGWLGADLEKIWVSEFCI